MYYEVQGTHECMWVDMTREEASAAENTARFRARFLVTIPGKKRAPDYRQDRGQCYTYAGV